jgi:sialate O-acetylesterase
MTNVLFGDVYICGGQSNMAFPVRIMEQAAEEYRLADELSLIRVFSAGRGTSSDKPLADLVTVAQTWNLAKNAIEEFSAVCWVFGREVFKGLGGKVPIGLISSNKGGTGIELWSAPESLQSCNAAPWGDTTRDKYSTLYNSMLNPFLVGPMSLTGFTWYQGEANVGHQFERNLQYACLFPALIKSWRHKFRNPDAYFGFIQISTQCNGRGGMAEFRSIAQMSGLQLPKVGYATNADHGNGCNPHPPEKQYCAARLAKSLLALQFGMNVAWKSPSFRSQEAFHNPPAMLVRLNDVSARGLRNNQYPFNWLGGAFDCDGEQSTVVYEASGMVKRMRAPSVYQCAWAALLLNHTWVNATISVSEDGSALMLSAPPMYAGAGAPLASRYAWGNIPMMTVYDRETNLPVLPWNTLPILVEV